MAHLEISVLGPMQVERDGEPIAEPVYAKVLALLAYLAVEHDRPHQRSAIAGLLWPDQPESRARHSLRQALSTLRRAFDLDGAPSCIAVTRDTVAFNRGAGQDVDAIELGDLLDACDAHDHADSLTCESCAIRRERAVELYRGEFLDGFSIPDSDTFETWVQVWRERFRHRVTTALADLASWFERLDELDHAIAASRRLLELDPWQEPGHRRLMDLLWQNGNRAAALAQYERCRVVLDEELGVEPELETTELYLRIRDGEFETGAAPAESADARAGRIPVPTTRLIGRGRELEEISDLLAQRGCRLLTLVGPGGIGKTRLALHLARNRERQGRGAASFVSLASARDAESVQLALVTALGLSLHGSATPMRQLTDWLRDREVLLVLDNAEHLTTELDVIAELLAAAAHLTVLVTSRERLQIAGEWTYEVQGLTMPKGEETDAFEGYDAVELLTERLRQVRSGEPLRHDERPAVLRICQLTGGMPLALELAAAWASTLTLPQIASEIQQNLDFLAGPARDRPDRHASMRAVFTSSWEMLAPPEQAAYRRLSVFTDGFDLNAAETITGTGVPSLGALINSSLLSWSASGRYHLHGLLGQFGDSLLRQEPTEHHDVHQRHARFFLAVLAERKEALAGRDQQAALHEIGDNIGNIHRAWDWAVANGMVADLIDAAPGLWHYYVIRGQMRAGAATFGRMLDGLETQCPSNRDTCGRALAIARVYTGGFRSGLGRYNEGIALLRQGIATLRTLATGRELGLALNMLAAALRMKGQFDEARSCLQESLAEADRAGDRWGMAFALNDLGMISHQQFGESDAWRHCERSRSMFRQLGDARGQAFAAHNLGMIAMERGEHRRAMSLHREALTLRTESADDWGVAASLIQLGIVAGSMGTDDTARQHLRRALRIAWENSVVPVVLEALIELTALSTRDGDSERADSALAAIAAHPALPGQLRPRLASLMMDAGIEPAWPDPTADDDRWAVREVDAMARAAVSNVVEDPP